MKQVIPILLLLLAANCRGQDKLPVSTLPAAGPEKAVVFFITGDGGMNDFSTAFISRLNKAGFTVHALNARSYFWKKKTPEQAASDIADFLAMQHKQQKASPFLFIGYSFGADLLPFILNKMPAAIKAGTIGLVLIAPSASTDFEVHLTEMMGFNSAHGLTVAEEINTVSVPKILAIVDESAHEFKPELVHLSTFKLIKLKGGHHFEGNENLLVSIISENF